ncbi:MAG: uracil-DNA glycosylase family protein [Pseudomonadota bacterium]
MATLKSLHRDILRCRICREAPQFGEPLPHQPRPVLQLSSQARLAVFSQAPGNIAHQTGVPFNDPSGNRLRDWLGLSREEFYDTDKLAIIPMGFCFPGYDGKGGDLPPRKECAPAWRAQVMEKTPQIETAILVGGYSQKWHLGKDASKTLTQTVANWRAFAPRFFPIPHPSWRNTGWLKKNPWFEADVLPLLRRRVRELIKN